MISKRPPRSKVPQHLTITPQGNKLGNWSNTYINFQVKNLRRVISLNPQMGSDARVEVEVTKLWGDDEIASAVVHPETAAEGCEVRIDLNI